MSEIVYFELNNWFSGRDYPESEPFLTWMKDENLRTYFQNNEWCKKNKLCVVEHIIDQSNNFLITAPKDWVLEQCPELLKEYSGFLRFPNRTGKVYSQFRKCCEGKTDIIDGKSIIYNGEFLSYDSKYFGTHYRGCF